jgi:spore coat protein A, manganese oxidase
MMESEPPQEPGLWLNGQKWDGVLTETPRVGSTEDWNIIDTTGDTHPIHLHLVQFQLVCRIPINSEAYRKAWTAINGEPPLPLNQTPVEVDPTPYFTGQPIYPTQSEMGWKDTIQAWGNYVTIIRSRWAPIDAPTSGPGAPQPRTNLYPFDPTYGPGYVWHCHILDHEDNEMMRPYKVAP